MRSFMAEKRAGYFVVATIIGLVISLVILRITWQSFHTNKAESGLPEE